MDSSRLPSSSAGVIAQITDHRINRIDEWLQRSYLDPAVKLCRLMGAGRCPRIEILKGVCFFRKIEAQMFEFLKQEWNNYIRTGARPQETPPAATPAAMVAGPHAPVPAGSPITSQYGPRNVPVGSSNHQGIDYGVPIGTRVSAVADGQVVRAAFNNFFGDIVVVKHADGRFTGYAHLSSYSVSLGDKVLAGDQIGLSGKSGKGSGQHLHFGVWNADANVSPTGGMGFQDSEHAEDPNTFLASLTSSPNAGEGAAPTGRDGDVSPPSAATLPNETGGPENQNAGAGGAAKPIIIIYGQGAAEHDNDTDGGPSNLPSDGGNLGAGDGNSDSGYDDTTGPDGGLGAGGGDNGPDSANGPDNGDSHSAIGGSDGPVGASGSDGGGDTSSSGGDNGDYPTINIDGVWNGPSGDVDSDPGGGSDSGGSGGGFDPSDIGGASNDLA